MGDSKSKFPDVKEILGMFSKLFSDVKKSVGEIVCNYKKAHEADKTTETPKEKPEESKAPKKPAAKTSEDKKDKK